MAGGIDWFRWHHGSVTDPKFQLVARKSKQALASVIAVWAFVLEQASASEDRGNFGSIDCEAIDCLLGIEDGATELILAAMTERGLIADCVVSAWEKRQPKREDDTAADRKRRQREREHELRMAQIAAEKESHSVTQKVSDIPDSHALSRTVTQSHDRGEERRVEKNKKEEKARAPAPGVLRPDDVSPQTWADWVKLRNAKRATISETVVSGARAEAEKAGMSLDGFLQVWCVRGSQGLQADWLMSNERAAHSSKPKVRGLVL